MRIGLVGYGLGGRVFHAPYIEAADGVELAGVVTRDPARRAQVAEDFPDVPCFDTLTDLLDAGVDAVTITTPPQTRHDLVIEAVERGVPVVADKPFAPDADAGQALVDAAAAAGVLLGVFHNRRWDTDIRTLRTILDRGDLGAAWRVESRFDLDEPGTIDPGPFGGLLRDLGTHLADQLLWLFGPVAQVYGSLDYIDTPAGRTDAGFIVTLQHESGTTSTMSASKANHAVGREIRVYGERGSYVSQMSDVQTAAIFAGRRPAREGAEWGYEAEERWGVLSTVDGQCRVASERGAYQDYYSQFARAVAGDAELPVTGDDAVRTLRVLDAARLSAETGRAIDL